MSDTASHLRTLSVKILSAAAITALIGCGRSELVNLSLPEAIPAGEPFVVTVDHMLDDEYETIFDENGSFVFAAIVPDTWSALSASYEGTAGAVPYSSAVTISGAPPETSEVILDELKDEIGYGGDVLCGASVALREGPLSSDPLIATLFSSAVELPMESRSADPFSLAAYAGGSVYMVGDVGSCLGPNGLLIDNLVLDVGGGNLLTNPSFESGITGWDDSASGVDCVNEFLGAGDTTGGAGEWDVPTPTDGTLLFASDVDNSDECVISQMVAVPGGAGAATLTGDVGANVFIPFFFTLDAGSLEPEPGEQVIWFRTDDIPLYTSLTDGDGGQLSVNFIATVDTEDEQNVLFIHGQYAETPEEVVVMAVSSALRRLAPSAGGAPIAAPVVSPLATPGYVGLGIWFLTGGFGPSGPLIVPQSVDSSLLILPAIVPAEIPTLSGFMLMILSVVIGGLGLSRRRFKK